MSACEINQMEDTTKKACRQRCSSLLRHIKEEVNNRQQTLSVLCPVIEQNDTLPQKRYVLKEVDSVRTARIQSFSNWPHCTPSSAVMSSNGWFYCNVNDRVICIYCNAICHGWTNTDDPGEVHKNLSPQCPLVLSIPSLSNSPSIVNTTLGETLQPCHASMCEISKRQTTFENKAWTQTSPNVDDLTRAGFFFSGIGNTVICFYCGGSLHKWSENDTPLIEHARWFPNCTYAKHLCGDQYHAKIQTSKKQLTKETTIDKETLVRLVNARLDLPIVQRLRTQYRISIIKRCIEDQLKNKQDDFSSDHDLVMACFILQKQIDIIKGNSDKLIIPSQKQTSDSSIKSSDVKLEECLICITEERQLACMPCGHLCACVTCSYALRSCPICRQKIQSFVRIYC
jgi:baculoviral IAP repeat-containing protein 7/8